MKKIFNNEEIIIRELVPADLKLVKKFRKFINSAIQEEAKILLKKKLSIKEEKEFLKARLSEIKRKTGVFLLAQNSKGEIIGTSDICASLGKKDHVGTFGIVINKRYRGMGLGLYLSIQVIKIARKKLKIKTIMLTVFSTNKIAINLYKKLGFYEVALIPRMFKNKGRFCDEIIMLKDV